MEPTAALNLFGSLRRCLAKRLLFVAVFFLITLPEPVIVGRSAIRHFPCPGNTGSKGAQVQQKRSSPPISAADPAELLRLGRASHINSRYDNAIRYCRQAVSAAHTAGRHAVEIEAYNELASIYSDQDDSARMSQAAEQALQLSKSAGLPGEPMALATMGLVSFISSDLRKALELLEQSLKAAEAAKDIPARAKANLCLGYTYGNMGQIGASLSFYRKSLELCRQSGDPIGQGLALRAIGGALSLRGEKLEARKLWDEAMNLFSNAGYLYGEATTLNDIAYLYQDVGNKKEALSDYQRALELFRKIGNKRYEALTLGYVARIYAGENKPAQALELFEQKLAYSRKSGDSRTTAYTLTDIAALKRDEGHLDMAMALLNEALPLCGEDSRGQGYVLKEIGRTFEAAGNRPQALRYYERALDLISKAEERRGEVSTLYRIATVERDMGRLTQARSDIEKAIAIIESVRSKIASGDLRTSYFQTVWDDYKLEVDILMMLHGAGDPGGAFANSALEANERSHARTLLDFLGSFGVEIRQGLDPSLLTSEREVQRQLNEAAATRARLIVAGAAEARITEATKQVDNLLDDYQDLESRISSVSPKYGSITAASPSSVPDLEALLKPGTLLLEYYLGDSVSYLWVVSNSSIRTFELPPRKEIERQAGELYSSLTFREKLADGSVADRSTQRLAEADALSLKGMANLSKILLSPAAELLGDNRLVIVADGVLQYLPFAALTDPSSADGGPLIVNHEIVSLPSASALEAIRKETAHRKPAAKDLAIFADPVFEPDDPRFRQRVTTSTAAYSAERNSDETIGHGRARQRPLRGSPTPAQPRPRFHRLPHAKEEAAAVLKAASGLDNWTVLDFDANRAAAMDPRLADYRIIHFATHGQVDTANPELSGLVLSLVNRKKQEQDGFLRLNEIYNLNLPADLVVLSACKTAVGTEMKGEGLIALTRGFMYAGAKSVVGTLWEVDDKATAQIMGLFYRNMFGPAKMRPAAALRAAQIEMWKQSQTKVPYFWAAFVLQGEWN